jgi:hypothetical protein
MGLCFIFQGGPATAVFETSCNQDPHYSYLHTCTLLPVLVTNNYLGVYALTVSNGLGSFKQRFSVLSSGD